MKVKGNFIESPPQLINFSKVLQNKISPMTTRGVEVIVYLSNPDFPCVKQCLEAVLEHSLQGHLIIIDDHSGKESKAGILSLIKPHADRCLLIENLDTLGYSRSINKALTQVTTSDHIVLLDSKVIVSRNWLENMLECLQKDNKTGVVTPLFSTNFDQICSGKDSAASHSQGSLEMMALVAENSSAYDFPAISSVNASCLMMKREVLGRVGVLQTTLTEKNEAIQEFLERVSGANFKIRLADQCYVFQSDFEKTTVSSKDADIIRRVVERIQHAFDSTNLKKELFSKSILFLMPGPREKDGADIIIQEVSCLRSCGFNVKVAYSKSHLNHFLFQYLEAHSFSRIYNDEQELMKLSSEFDIVVATSTYAVRNLKRMMQVNPEIIPIYYIQDHESVFYPNGDVIKEKADELYVSGSQIICLTKTDGLYEKIAQRYDVNVVKLSAGLDKSIYNWFANSSSAVNSPVRITAMIQPNNPKRASPETLSVLKAVKRKYKGKVDIRVFGCGEEDMEMLEESKGFRFINFGELKRIEIARLLEGADIFIDLSGRRDFNHLILGAMAAGCASVLLRSDGVREFSQDMKNCLLVDTRESKPVVGALEKVLRNKDFLTRIKESAVRTAKDYSVRKTVWEEILIFNRALGLAENKPFAAGKDISEQTSPVI